MYGNLYHDLGMWTSRGPWRRELPGGRAYIRKFLTKREYVTEWDGSRTVQEPPLPHHATLFRLYYGLDDDGPKRSYAEVGRIVGLSGSRVRQVVHRILRDLRHPDRLYQIFEKGR